ncbi:MAG TPA: NADH-quinone oxidoreductase subunit C [Candidatus Acidoferrum sp.]|nr:NADH-quinone oxidoreductase subunit C [Candidatus Acidoferrum sp.]
MDSQEIAKHPVAEKLQAWDSRAVAGLSEFRGEVTLIVLREHIVPVAEYLAKEPSLGFNFLSDITVVDRFPLEPRFEINYQFLSLLRKERLRLRVKVGGEDPSIPSVTPLFPTANWHERESFDLFGIRFEGHPDLKRIVMPDDWQGYPLRKDYPTEGPR